MGCFRIGPEDKVGLGIPVFTTMVRGNDNCNLDIFVNKTKTMPCALLLHYICHFKLFPYAVRLLIQLVCCIFTIYENHGNQDP